MSARKNIFIEKGSDLVEEFNTIFMEVEKSIIQGLTEAESESLRKLLIKVKVTM